MQIIGHRGSAGTAPENTLLGIKVALEAGAPWVEIDVRLCHEQLFVIHDEDVARTTNGNGSIYELSLNAIKQLDAGAGEPVPTLSQIMDTLDACAGLNIELKDSLSLNATLAVVERYLDRNPAWHNRLMLSTFEQNIHQEMAAKLPTGCLLGVLMKEAHADAAQYAKKLNAYSLNLSRAQLDAALVKAAHTLALKVFVYTVNEESDIDECLSLNVDAIYTDFPARAARLIETKQKGLGKA